MSLPDVRLPRSADHPWHVAINRYEAPHRVRSGDVVSPEIDGKEFMYDAKHAAEEAPRLALLFGRERRGELPKIHHQCSRDAAGETVPDNHLTCCLGVECRKCPHLAAIDTIPSQSVTPEERDVIKAWTCVAHILRRGGDAANEGFVLTTDDQMYWRNLYASLAGGQPEEPMGGEGWVHV